tara:strand:- start:2401 stop:2709 length:309 start_codon:yes stop_codon:yes gene_type:complete
MRRIKMTTGAISKSIRRQKEQRLAKVAQSFFKDGATKFGRARIDRALSSIYGHVIPQKNIGIGKAVKKYNKKLKLKNTLVKAAKKKDYNETMFTLTGNKKFI